ncbi:MAG: hypothetical protein D6773_00340 [Alphaproteobacteria bacterium]|nr:MAG: hypothetical protein D6773_00340 [Alphaproteobacteria bacterium]
MANPERGEVRLELSSGTLTLVPELGRVAAWTHDVGIHDIALLFQRLTGEKLPEDMGGALLRGPDPFVVMKGLEHLGRENNAAEIAAAMKPAEVFAAGAALVECLVAGQDEAEGDTGGKGPAAGASG